MKSKFGMGGIHIAADHPAVEIRDNYFIGADDPDAGITISKEKVEVRKLVLAGAEHGPRFSALVNGPKWHKRRLVRWWRAVWVGIARFALRRAT